MRVRVEFEADLGLWEIYADDRRAGYTKFRRQGDLVALDHTEINERYEGEGLGGDLIRHILDELREEGLGVLPFCQFTRSWIERHPEYIDLVPDNQRSRFGFEPEV